MQRISSRATFWYKRIFPALWFGLLAAFVVGLLINGVPDPMLIIVPVAMMIFGFVFMKKLVFDLVDEVLDAGDALVVRNGSQEERIALSDIMNVNYTPLLNPPRVTLSLRRPTMFGTQVTFCAPVRFVPFTTSPIIDELIQRIDTARRR